MLIINYDLLCLLYFLLSAAISQSFNPIAKLVISIGIESKEATVEFQIHPVTTEAKVRKCSI